MGLVVTGLSQTDDVGAIHIALAGAGLATDRLQVIGPDESTEAPSSRLLDTNLMTSDGGTGVPGLSNVHQPRLYFRNESLSDRLGDLEIPESELDNYVEALERGRTIIAYFAHDSDAEKVEEIFRNSGLANVRRF